MSSEPAISFLVSTRNRAAVAHDCVCQLLSSPRKDIEVIVRDNGSTDHTLQLLRAIEDPRLQVHASPANQGTISFFEISKIATGNVVTWMSDEDDFQFSNLDLFLSKFDDNVSCNVVIGSILVGKGRQVAFSEEIIRDPLKVCEKSLSFSGCGGVFVRRSALAAVHSLCVQDLEDAYALWNYYPVGFFASRCATDYLATTSRIAVIQTRFARTTNNWSEEGVKNDPRPPHYYPESVFDRLCSNLVNIYFKPLTAMEKVSIALTLIRQFQLQAAGFSSPALRELLSENYPCETVKSYVNRVHELRLADPVGRFLWTHGRTLEIPARFLRTLTHWRRLGAS